MASKKIIEELKQRPSPWGADGRTEFNWNKALVHLVRRASLGSTSAYYRLRRMDADTKARAWMFTSQSVKDRFGRGQG